MHKTSSPSLLIKLHARALSLPFSVEAAVAKQSQVLFTNRIRTDGYAVDFIFARPAKPGSELPELDFDDFTEDELQDTFHLWGVDPGITEIFVAVDDHEDDAHQIRKMSTTEFHVQAGYEKTNQKIAKMKKACGIYDIEKSIPSPKSASTDRFSDYTSVVLRHLLLIMCLLPTTAF
jgi:hypothetical protein